MPARPTTPPTAATAASSSAAASADPHKPASEVMSRATRAAAVPIDAKSSAAATFSGSAAAAPVAHPPAANATAAAPAPAAASTTSSISSFGYGLFSMARTAVKAVPFVSDVTYDSAAANVNSGISSAVAGSEKFLRGVGNGVVGYTTQAIDKISTVSSESVAPALRSAADSAAAATTSGFNTVATATRVHVAPRVEAITTGAMKGAVNVTNAVSTQTGKVMDSMDGGVRRVITDSGMASEEQLQSNSFVQITEVLSTLFDMIGQLKGRISHLSTGDMIHSLSVWSELQNRISAIELETAEVREHDRAIASHVGAAPVTSSALTVSAQPIAVSNGGSATAYRVVTVQQHNAQLKAAAATSGGATPFVGVVSRHPLADAMDAFPPDSMFSALTAALKAAPARRTSELYPPLPPKPAAASAAAAEGAVDVKADSKLDSLSSAAEASSHVPTELGAWHTFSRPDVSAEAANANASASSSAAAAASPAVGVAPPPPPSHLPIPPHISTPPPAVAFPHRTGELQRAIKFAVCAYGSLFLKFLGLPVSLGSGEALVEEVCGVPARDVIDAKWNSAIGAPGFYLAIDHKHRQIVFVCRGTSRVMDAITDLKCDYIPFAVNHPDASGKMIRTRGWAHDGILQSANYFDVNLKPKLKELMKTHNSYSLLLTGHSLGAAVPSILSLLWMSDPELSPPERQLKCYAFGPPCVVSLNLSVLGRAHVLSIGNGHDVIPKLSKGAIHDLATVILRLSRPHQFATTAATSAGTGPVACDLLAELLKTRSAPGSTARQREDAYFVALYASIRGLMDGEHLVPVGQYYQLWPVTKPNALTAGMRPVSAAAAASSVSPAFASAAAVAIDTKDKASMIGGGDSKSAPTPYSFVSDGFRDRIDMSIGWAIFQSAVSPACESMPPLSSLAVSQHLPEQYYHSLCGTTHQEMAVALPIQSIGSGTSSVVISKK